MSSSPVVDMQALVAAITKAMETPAEKRVRMFREYEAELQDIRDKQSFVAKQPSPRAPDLGPPCPYADMSTSKLTPDQVFARNLWDHPDPKMRDHARTAAVPPGELSDGAADDIARFAADRDRFVHDEYAKMHVSILRRMYTNSASAKSTKGANDAAWSAALVAGGLLLDDAAPGFFQVREVDDNVCFLSGEEAAVEPSPSLIVPGIIPTGAQVVFVGNQASGKTTMVTTLLAAVAHGRPWLGRPTNRSQCAIVNFDGRDSDLRQLLHEAGAGGKVSIASYPEHNLSSDRFWAALEKRYGNGKPALIAIDSLSRGNPDVDEKDARFAAPVLRAAEISSRYPITFVWIHHTPVKVRGDDLNDWLRGTSALGAAFDIGFGLSRVSENASPRETIIKVQTPKMRPKGFVKPAPFKLRMTDAGLSLHDETARKVPLTDDELVLEAVKATPGITSAGIEAEVCGRRENVRSARNRLVETGAIENRGTEKRPCWYLTTA
jgi:hypothetical protein